jgi:hypothetical protein
MARNALLIEITDEDIQWAASQDRWNCAIVRSIQRKIPEALYVTADTKAIRFTLPNDGPAGTRYEFEVTPEALAVEKDFDLTGNVSSDHRTFSINAIAAVPMQHRKRDERIKERTRTRENRSRSRNPVVRQTNRFLTAESNESNQADSPQA